MRRFDYRNLIIKKLDELKISLESEIDCESAIVALKLEFIKKMACEIDDFEVIGMVGKIEVQHKKVLDDYDDYLSYQNEYFSFSAPYIYENNNYAAFCNKLEMTLSSSDKYGIDMSIYQEAVERNKDALIRYGLYRNLSRYVKNETAMDKAFQMVKKKDLSIHRDEDNKYIVPTEDQISSAFDSAKNEINRLAKKHVAIQICEVL
jgi:hypothetical protein